MANTKKNNNWSVDKFVDSVKSAIKKTNDLALNVAEDVVEGALKNGAQWQKLTAKATKGGLELTAKQQDIAFDTIVTVKKQWEGGYKRVRKIFA